MSKNNGSPDIQVGLVQINNSFSGQNYMPYSVGLLQAYVQKYAAAPERYKFILPIYCRDRVQQMVDHLAGADIVGFSTYVWNNNVSLETARRLKQANPDVLIVFGGPQVPDKAEDFLRKHPFIDIACHGEGEQVFLSVLENYPDESWEQVPSISYIDMGGVFVNQEKVARIKELEEVPSPYLDGVFDSLIEANPDEVWLILWETNRGCPFSCTFCDWGSATAAKVYRFEQERLFEEIKWFAERKIEFVFCCDANFGILPRDVEIAEYMAAIKEETGYPHALSVQNTKNATDRAYKVQKILSEAKLNKGVTISLQSVDPNTLESIKRQNISSDSFQELQRRFTRDRVETYTDMILGLPGETYDTFVDGISDIIENGQHNRVQFNNLSILPNAEMGDPEYQAKYGMEVAPSQIFNIHGSLNDLEEEIHEIQDLVIATAAMPREDWVRTRAFSWMTGFLHFDKVLQMPLIMLHEICEISYRDLIEAFIDIDQQQYPILSRVEKFFTDKALDIQGGGFEYCLSNEWLNIGWPADEYMLIELCVGGDLAAFYDEALRRLTQLLVSKDLDLPPELLQQAIQLNQDLIKQPFQREDLEFNSSYNLWEFYQSVLIGNPIPVEQDQCVYQIERSSEIYESWEDWFREVIWYGNKKGAYLYGNEQVGRQLAGHY
jgi:radical SAM superfamily enzyme YgiQ (UPF0313 family)